MNETKSFGDGQTGDRVRIGACLVDLSTGELSREGEQIRLGPRAVRLLRVLLEAKGELVSNEEIHRRVWQRTVVEHNTVQAHVSSLRRALGGDRSFLQTYPGRGYRLTLDARSAVATDESADVAADSDLSTTFPAATEQLIGRERLLQVLTPMLGNHRFVTLVGAGGIGKTRLMLDVARRSEARFPGGLFLVDLASVSDPSLAHTVLITSIGPPSTFQRSLADRARSLGKKPVLIALDNCEHLVEEIASAVDVLLAANPAIHILATSREPVRATSEVVFQVPPLEVPPHEQNLPSQLLSYSSIELFLSRSPNLQAKFGSNAEVDRAVSRICRNLDGIPLAIELAAARARSLGVEVVAARLRDCLDLMKGGARTAPSRHKTLRATLTWSYELLELPQRAVFARLAIFAGGFTMEGACHVITEDLLDENAVIGHIADLVDKSLLSAELGARGTRYRFLETTRAFALEKLSKSGESIQLSERHARFYLERLEPISTDADPRSFRDNVAAFKSELDNVRACLDWCYSPSGDVVLGFGLAARAVQLMLDSFMVQEATFYSARAIEMTPDGLVVDMLSDLQLRASKVTGGVYVTGATDSAMREWQDVLERARRLGNEGFEIRAYWGLWTICFFAGRPNDALGFANQFANFAERTGNRRCIELGDRVLGVSMHYLGDQPGARQHLENMIERYVHKANPIIGAGLMNHATSARATLARVLWFQGLQDQAYELARSTVAEAVSQDHPPTICFVVVECALPLSLLRGDTSATREFLALLFASTQRQAYVVFEIVGRCYETLVDGNVATGPGLPSMLDELKAMRFEMYSTEIRLHLAHRIAEAGHVSRAAHLIDESIAATVETGEGLWQPELTRMQVEYALRSNEAEVPAGAEQSVRGALAQAHAQGSLTLELRAALTLARLLRRLERNAEGLQTLDAVYSRFPRGLALDDAEEARIVLTTVVNATT